MMEDDARAARYSDLFESRHEHTSDCAYCPVCATISVARDTRPDVVEHMAAAAREFLLAVGLLLEEVGEKIGKPEDEPSRAAGSEDGKVRRIDIDAGGA
jgi:hypothetical protein